MIEDNHFIGWGGGGGAGAPGLTGDPASNSVSVTGGAGGWGGSGGAAGGGGGGGGFGALLGAITSFTNTGEIYGGAGGGGGSGMDQNGGGGGGGVGLYFAPSSTSSLITNKGTIRGGAGGDGGGGRSIEDYPMMEIGGGGGGGGTGVVMWAGELINATEASIVGGDGGMGAYWHGNRGDGGNALNVHGTEMLVTNLGVMTGGAGIDGGVGVAILGDNNRVINGGSIEGGLSGDSWSPGGITRANAVSIPGNDNTLELWSGYSFTGNISVTGSGNVFALGGEADASFATEAIGTQFQNFEGYRKTGSSTWTLTGSTAVVTPWVIEQGTLAISSDANLGAAAGTPTLDGGTLRSTADIATGRSLVLGAAGGTLLQDPGTTLALGGSITGIGSLAKTGEGTLVLSGANTYAGDATIAAGTLRAGATDTLSAVSRHAVASGATLDLAGFNQTVGGLANAGLVNMGTGTAPGTVLTVVGNYVGNGGTIAMNTVLGGDSSPTDRLVINGGSASGNTVLRFTNVGGTGAQTVQGIRVVQTTNGASTEPEAFGLGRYRYTAGAYEYLLVRKGEDWFLTSRLEGGGPCETDCTPIYRPEVPVYTTIPAMARSLGLAMLGTLHERVGEEENIRGTVPSRSHLNGTWGRVIAERQTNTFGGAANPSVDGNLWGFQAGVDLYRETTAADHRDHAGFYFAYGGFSSTSLRGDVHGTTNATAGSLRLEGPSVGVYWTHFGPSGWYVDAVAQGSWYDAKTSSIAGSSLNTSVDGLTTSLEAGYPIQFENGAWLVEPQAQLIYQYFAVNSAQDDISQMNWITGDAWTARLGVRLQHTHRAEDGSLWQPYARLNLWQNFNGSDGLSFDGNSPIQTFFGGTSLEGAIGVTAKIDRMTSLYGEASYRHSIGGPQQASAISGTLGLRINF